MTEQKQTTGNGGFVLAAIGVLAVPLLIIVLIVGFFSFTFVDQGEVAVKTRTGKLVTDTPLQPGLHFKIPLVESFIKYSVRSEAFTQRGKDTVQALTQEGLNLETLDMTVRFHMNAPAAPKVYSELGSEKMVLQKLVQPTIRSAIRSCTAQFSAQEIYSNQRDALADCIDNRTQQDFSKFGYEVEQVQIRNIMLPAKVRDAIQSKEQKQQEIEAQQAQLEVVKLKADQRREEAKGIRDSQEIIQKTLTPRYLQYLFITEGLEKGDSIYVPMSQDGLELYKDVDSIKNGSQ